MFSQWKTQIVKNLALSVVMCGLSCSGGCAMSYGPKFTEVSVDTGSALIYVYRRPSISGSAMSSKPMLVVDGESIAKIKNGGYVHLQVEPGMHRVELIQTLFGKVVGEAYKEVQFSINSGDVKYFEYAEITTGYERYGETEVAEIEQVFMEVPKAFGEKRIQKTRLLSREN